MSISLQGDGEELWMKLVEAYSSPMFSTVERLSARQTFLSRDADRVATIKSHLIKDKFWWLALGLVEELAPEERVPLLPELIYWLFSSRLGDVPPIQALLLSLPKDILATELEPLSEPYLASDDDENWDLLLTLCEQFDIALTTRVALRATESASADVQEIGQHFLTTYCLPPFARRQQLPPGF